LSEDREFVYTLSIGKDPDEPIEPSKDPVMCEKCGEHIPVTEIYVYKGDSYHEKCLPGPAREVATKAG